MLLPISIGSHTSSSFSELPEEESPVHNSLEEKISGKEPYKFRYPNFHRKNEEQFRLLHAQKKREAEMKSKRFSPSNNVPKIEGFEIKKNNENSEALSRTSSSLSSGSASSATSSEGSRKGALALSLRLTI